MITARLAAEQGREVFAVPGFVKEDTSRGTNALLKEGAALIERAQDVIDAVMAQLEPALRLRLQPSREQNERGDQLVRAALSICSNIAEACGRGTVPEFRQFLLYARGSAQETVTHLRVAAALDAAHARTIGALEGRVIVISKMISRLHAHPPPDR